ncbi:MAG: hypothetical protein ABEK12_04280 [Candidatus Nanohaloarchaea archaeon]
MDGEPRGDVATESVQGTAGTLTPVPGGVGPLTVAVTMQNLVTCYRLQDR